MVKRNTKKGTKTKKKLIIDEYDPIIYPRKLWVGKNASLKDLQKRFLTRDGEEIDESWDPTDGTFTIYVQDRVTGKCGCYVNIADWAYDENLINVIAHEAEHVKISIFHDCHVESNFDAQEVDAYLVGWCTQCIYNTVTKK